MTRLPVPEYAPFPDAVFKKRLGLAVESMRRHTSDEGWQLFAGLEAAGYHLAGHGVRADFMSTRDHVTIQDTTDCRRLIEVFEPSTVVLQDKREWVGRTAGRGFDARERFTNLDALRDRPDVFKVTVIKDAHADHALHGEVAREAGIHAWVTYYDVDRVCSLAPFLRREHVVRTYHTVDAHTVPAYTADGRRGCLLSGAVSGAYPLRSRLIREAHRLPEVTVLPHPGYRRDGCHTPAFLRQLSQFKVAVCTASNYQYLLRKVIEATACGCIVITNLRETVPSIDGNLVRITDDMSTEIIGGLIGFELRHYDPGRQWDFAEAARTMYDYRMEGRRLATAIEQLRRDYPCS